VARRGVRSAPAVRDACAVAPIARGAVRVTRWRTT